MLAISLTLKLRTHTFGGFPPIPPAAGAGILSNSREGCDRLIKSTRPQTLFYFLCRAWASAYKHFKNSRESPSRFKKQNKNKTATTREKKEQNRVEDKPRLVSFNPCTKNNHTPKTNYQPFSILHYYGGETGLCRLVGSMQKDLRALS